MSEKKYFYKGQSLKEVCDTYNIKYLTVLKRINNFKHKNTNLNDDEIVSKLLEENYLLFYNNIPLKDYCSDLNIDFNKLKSYINKERKNNSELSNEEIIDKYIEKNKFHGNSKHFYMGKTLKEYCDENNIHYPTIIRAINRIKEKNKSIKYNDDEIVSKVLENYVNNDNVLKNKCELFKIDYSNVKSLIELGFTNNQALNIIWYFYDKEINGNKQISDIKLKEIISLTNSIKNNEYKIKNKDLYNLIGIYKCELFDTSSIIKDLLKKPIVKSINNFAINFDIKLNTKNIEQMLKEINYNLVHYINYTNSNNYDELIKRFNITLKAYFKNYLNSNKKDKVLIKK